MITTYYMLFFIFMNDTLYKMSTSPITQLECEEMLDGQIDVYTKLNVPRQHMWGDCIEKTQRTLEIKPGDDIGSKPVPLN